MGGHWMHDASSAKSDTSNKLYVLGPVGRWYKTMAAWKVNSGSAISGVQETRPRSIVVHDPDTMAKALCCDLKWDDGWDLTPAPKSPVPGNGDSGDDGANEGMPYDSGDDGANEGMPYDSGDDRERGHAVRLGRRRRERGHAVRLGDDGANEGMPYDSGDDGANEGMPYGYK